MLKNTTAAPPLCGTFFRYDNMVFGPKHPHLIWKSVILTVSDNFLLVFSRQKLFGAFSLVYPSTFFCKWSKAVLGANLYIFDE